MAYATVGVWLASAPTDVPRQRWWTRCASAQTHSLTKLTDKGLCASAAEESLATAPNGTLRQRRGGAVAMEPASCPPAMQPDDPPKPQPRQRFRSVPHRSARLAGCLCSLLCSCFEAHMLAQHC